MPSIIMSVQFGLSAGVGGGGVMKFVTVLNCRSTSSRLVLHHDNTCNTNDAIRHYVSSVPRPVRLSGVGDMKDVSES